MAGYQLGSLDLLDVVIPGSISTLNWAKPPRGESRNMFGSWQWRSSIGIPKPGVVDSICGRRCRCSFLVHDYIAACHRHGSILISSRGYSRISDGHQNNLTSPNPGLNTSLPTPNNLERFCPRIAEAPARNTTRRDPTTSAKNLSTCICALPPRKTRNRLTTERAIFLPLSCRRTTTIERSCLRTNRVGRGLQYCHCSPLNLRSSFDRKTETLTQIHLVIPTHVPPPTPWPTVHCLQEEGRRRKKRRRRERKYKTLTDRRRGYLSLIAIETKDWKD